MRKKEEKWKGTVKMGGVFEGDESKLAQVLKKRKSTENAKKKKDSLFLSSNKKRKKRLKNLFEYARWKSEKASRSWLTIAMIGQGGHGAEGIEGGKLLGKRKPRPLLKEEETSSVDLRNERDEKTAIDGPAERSRN